MEQQQASSNKYKHPLDDYITQKVIDLESMKDESRQKRLLADLRRSIGKEPGEAPEVWGLLLEGMPSFMQSEYQIPSKAEWAAFTALGLAALHVQGSKVSLSDLKNTKNGLGQAVRQLVPEGDADAMDRVMRRFSCIVTASSREELAVHLRSMIQLLKDKGIPLNYGRLAGQLQDFQNPKKIHRVQLLWGQEFYTLPQKAENPEEQDKEPHSTGKKG